MERLRGAQRPGAWATASTTPRLPPPAELGTSTTRTPGSSPPWAACCPASPTACAQRPPPVATAPQPPPSRSRRSREVGAGQGWVVRPTPQAVSQGLEGQSLGRTKPISAHTATREVGRGWGEALALPLGAPAPRIGRADSAWLGCCSACPGPRTSPAERAEADSDTRIQLSGCCPSGADCQV